MRDRALLELLYGTGARVSEVVGLGLSDLDFDEELILLTGKGSKQRLVPIGRTLKRALQRVPRCRWPLGRCSRTRRATASFSMRARVRSHDKESTSSCTSERSSSASSALAISAHVFRHSCATHMLAHGADIRVVQELLGHASIATTQLYTAVSVTTLQREYHDAHPRAHD